MYATHTDCRHNAHTHAHAHTKAAFQLSLAIDSPATSHHTPPVNIVNTQRTSNATTTSPWCRWPVRTTVSSVLILEGSRVSHGNCGGSGTESRRQHCSLLTTRFSLALLSHACLRFSQSPIAYSDRKGEPRVQEDRCSVRDVWQQTSAAPHAWS